MPAPPDANPHNRGRRDRPPNETPYPRRSSPRASRPVPANPQELVLFFCSYPPPPPPPRPPPPFRLNAPPSWPSSQLSQTPPCNLPGRFQIQTPFFPPGPPPPFPCGPPATIGFPAARIP